MNVLFILSKLYGGRTFSDSLMAVVKDMPQINPIVMEFIGQDYSRFKAPWLYRHLGSLKVAKCAKTKFDTHKLNINDFETIFIQSFELLPAFYKILRVKKSILALDSTNISSYSLITQQNRSGLTAASALLKTLLLYPIYYSCLRQIDCFLPRTNWCKSSLIKDYHIDAEKIFITPGSIDLKSWRLVERIKKDRPILLFVGNEFVRKGGEFLVNIYNQYLSDLCDLRIISNDNLVATYIQNIQGITWVSGIDHNSRDKLMLEFENADIFLHPTFKDQGGQACVEASAAGLPLIGRNVGGVADMIHDQENGILLPYNSSVNDWVVAIKNLVSDFNLRQKFGSASRRIVENNYSNSSLKSTLEKILN